jgi:hypothetical protein
MNDVGRTYGVADAAAGAAFEVDALDHDDADRFPIIRLA